MRPIDIGLLTTVGEVAVSPDGGRVAYTLTTCHLDANRSRTRIWMAATAGGPGRPLTTGDRADVTPRWSPDGTMLAWVSTADDGQREVHVLAVGPGEPVVVCRWPDDITELSWSPTGDRLAFVGRVRDPETYGAPGATKAAADMPPRRVTRLLARHNGDDWVFDRPPHVHVVPLDGSAPPLALTSGEFAASDAAWSPDGRRIAFVSARQPDWDLELRNDVWIIDADGSGHETKLTDTTAAWSALSWSTDGRRIAALVDPTPADGPRHGQVWLLDATTGAHERIGAEIDRNLAPYGASRPPVWSDDEVLVSAEDQGRIHVLALSPAGVRTVVDGDVVVRSFDGAGGTVAFAASTVTHPGDVWVTDATGREPRRLTDHGSTLRSRVALGAIERFTAVSTGGAEVECWAMAPIDAGAATRYPTILNVHGGPFTQYGVGFFDEFQLQAAAGFGVVYCNPRGSSGYTEAWGRAVRWPEAESDPGSGWGGVDYDDVMACMDAALERFDWIDADRLGVQGGSYGGYMTSWIVGHTDRFKAAISERAVNNLVTAEHNSDISGFFRDYVGWTHLQRPDVYVRQSPSTYVADMRTPLLLMHSEDDLRCPISQAEELFVSLRLLGRNPELVRFPGENHELSRAGSPQHRVMRAEIILEWFQRHLG